VTVAFAQQVCEGTIEKIPESPDSSARNNGVRGQLRPNRNCGLDMLTIEVGGKYQYYNYWWSYWYAAEAEKRKLFPLFREIEYFIGLDDFRLYLKKLIIQLTAKSYDEIISNFVKPNSMENWQYRLIKEKKLLFDCPSKYIAISPDRTYCYLMKGKRPSDIEGSKKIM
jgi:hypothetical protein